MRQVVLLALLGACEHDGNARIDLLRYQRALETATSDPAVGWDACATIAEPGLESDCRVAVIESWAAHKGEPTDALLDRCRRLQPPTMTAECAFQVGERRRDPAGCALAGIYEDDCRLHLATGDFDAWMTRDARLDDEELHQRMVHEAEAAGLRADDLRVWSAFFRRVFMQQLPLDREGCGALIEHLAESCRETGLQVYNDRLNMAADQGIYPCGGDELPAFVQTGDDVELEALRQRRERSDLCRRRGQP
jgi:hypothetical protein